MLLLGCTVLRHAYRQCAITELSHLLHVEVAEAQSIVDLHADAMNK